MSIIQEALKKAQRKGLLETRPPQKIASPQNGSVPKKTPFRMMPFLLIIVITAAFFAARHFSLEARSKLKNATKLGVVETALHQEITYKPVVDKKKEPSEPRPNLVTYLGKSEPRFVLNGIMYLEDGPQAIINDALVRKGDLINSATVVRINKNSVVLNLNDVEITLILKK